MADLYAPDARFEDEAVAYAPGQRGLVEVPELVPAIRLAGVHDVGPFARHERNSERPSRRGSPRSRSTSS